MRRAAEAGVWISVTLRQASARLEQTKSGDQRSTAYQSSELRSIAHTVERAGLLHQAPKRAAKQAGDVMLPLVRPRRREMRVMRTTQRGVICEVVNDDGTMAHVPNLIPFWRKHD
jgi:hypothetical protein